MPKDEDINCALLGSLKSNLFTKSFLFWTVLFKIEELFRLL